MSAGIIIFQDGEVQQFGEVLTTKGIIRAIQTLIPDLVKQERQSVLDTVTEEELKALIDKRARKTIDDGE